MNSAKTTPVTTDVSPPKKKRGAKLIYDFEALTEPKMSFGVKNRTARQLRTTISNANKEHHPKKFYAVDVDPKTDPNKANVRIVREV